MTTHTNRDSFQEHNTDDYTHWLTGTAFNNNTILMITHTNRDSFQQQHNTDDYTHWLTGTAFNNQHNTDNKILTNKAALQ